jgi:tRNA modification GTPase
VAFQALRLCFDRKDIMTNPTLLSCLTPPGRAALATLGLQGPAAWPVVRELFQTRKGSPLPESPVAGAFWLGRFGRELADEVVLAVHQVEPTARLEIHCHGGREVVRLLVELLTARGLVEVSWPEFLRQTTPGVLQAEAALALAQAPTVRTANILLDQYHGALPAALDVIRGALEANEEERAAALVDELAGRIPLGRHLTEPWQVVIAGAPNVGKSSLVNALAGYQRSIVAPTPGTTRDVVTTRLALDGWPIELADTAGLRGQGESIEQEGMARARARLEKADLVLWVLDASAERTEPEVPSAHLHRVINKVDLPAAWNLDEVGPALRVSARTGEGIEELVNAISRRLVPEVPPPGAAVPFTESVCAAILEARQCLSAGEKERARSVLDPCRTGPGR